ncbi:hypothetical protein L345_13201, partial [Ophiophagus hannah]
MYTLATRFCDEIHLYGFWPFPKDINGKPVKYHYYDDLNKTKKMKNEIHARSSAENMCMLERHKSKRCVKKKSMQAAQQGTDRIIKATSKKGESWNCGEAWFRKINSETDDKIPNVQVSVAHFILFKQQQYWVGRCTVAMRLERRFAWSLDRKREEEEEKTIKQCIRQVVVGPGKEVMKIKCSFQLTPNEIHMTY